MIDNKFDDDEYLIQNNAELNSRISVKIYFPNLHLVHHIANFGSFSEEQDEMFHQDICEMESMYQGL